MMRMILQAFIFLGWLWVVSLMEDHPWLDLAVVRQTIEPGGTGDPPPVAGLGRPHHIGAKTIAKHIVSGDLFQVVHEVDGLGVGHIGENLPVGVCHSDALFVAIGTAVSQLGTILDDGVGGEVATILTLTMQNVQNLLHHPVGLTGLGGLEGGVGPGRTGRGLEPDSVILFHCIVVLVIYPFPITKIQQIIGISKFF